MIAHPSSYTKSVAFLTALVLPALVLAGCQRDLPAPQSNNLDNPSGSTADSTRDRQREADPLQDNDSLAPERPSESNAVKAVAEAPRLLSADELQEGWISLFDGSTLFGWQRATDANWRVENGAIVVDQGELGLLCTKTQFANYVLRLDFRSAPGTNSGIFLHTPPQPKDPASDCYELNIADSDNPFPTGSLVKRRKAPGSFDSQDWQSYEITVNQDRVRIMLDGQQVLDYTDPHPLGRGHIGLQLNQGRVEFRNIKLRPLGLVSIFNGQDLTGWKAYPEGSVSTVTEAGHLSVRGGPGMLETHDTFGDFVFQLQCKTSGSNSGVFFRCIPGDVMMGYESQIHNGFKNDDRSQPVDHGTGGVFNRQEARWVVADDEQWFHKTIIADGAHMATWVNGYQVTDWTDNREPNENPRRGLRLEPGTIIFQGHDPLTDISFRNLRISEITHRSE